MTYPARAVVDLGAIAGNVARLREVAGPAEVMAVVKGDAYGHGLVPVARAALGAGATWLGVAQLGEALTLRAAGVDARTLTWLYAPGAPLAEALRADLDLSVAAPWALDEVVGAARESGVVARVHLKVDTGMGRSGLFLDEWGGLLDAAVRAQAAGEIDVVGVWSHLASADDAESGLTAEQTRVFAEAVRRAEDAGAHLEVRHLANSAGTLAHAATHFDLVRPGIAVVGLSPFGDRTADELGLTPAMRLEAELTIVKHAPAGQGVSYGHEYTTSEATSLAVVPLGYADGIPRHAGGAGPVQVGDTWSRIAGRVCMDQFVLDLGAGANAHAGDVAVLFGSGADGEPTAADWARAADTITYEIVTRLGPRVPRVHVGGRDA
ncbi:alanine racemase [Beutenbergia cavernae DSM 12333]|uniref:Alanine racemase n=1 Tax=Beutenbergia cavernae (strain ATCC BAA-8 / DSM 12333 / CCUG 43141 / JCM 11478 / NBRC 16432 / NCIMB 13614 / HKI 0122) TaxID=471853 RepID=ALR_BEUC1|nr:alanine racemase [Beutenbergia cavernae]C5BZY7.1 RecName: Full=Alanine racemase [Beutenbergia cavernae DSM 12333]ACQ81317.1 alanine racemase [Beutenbergia cavernae DSM 12333]